MVICVGVNFENICVDYKNDWTPAIYRPSVLEPGMCTK